MAVHCDYLVIATHAPIADQSGKASATLYETKFFPYTCYAVTGHTADLTKALFWDPTDPYNYLLISHESDGLRVVYGGADTKTGRIDDTE